MTGLREKILTEIDRLEEEVVQIRRNLHMYPELSGMEEKTSSIVSRYLADIGLEVRRCKNNYGVVGLLRGDKPGPTVALRADMDALALDEKTDLPFASKVEGVMHACGHDVHTAVLMGTAAALSTIQDELAGNALFLFQPSEEFFPGGALGMIDEGVIDDPKPDAIFSLHTSSFPVGQISIMAGSIIGSVSTMSLRIFGKGGHFSKPNLAVDPIVAASHVVVALNSMMTRKVDPLDSAVLTFGLIQGGTRDNIIGDMVVLRGNIGSLDEGLCESLMEELEKVVKGITESMGATYKLKYIHGYPTTRNDPEMAEYVKNIAAHVVGEQNIISSTPTLGGEDFSYFLQRVPGAMFFLGTQNPEKEPVPIMNHDPRFNPDERAISIGMKIMAHLVMQYAAR
ncbi:MAG: amidohydrolase [Deltaproteobacteria bacterium]|nr:amidohydrolase [Deltaproteobacteria bacterium]MBW2141166.1 amidohydrolase [Deltaproteobacteria bacterium]